MISVLARFPPTPLLNPVVGTNPSEFNHKMVYRKKGALRFLYLKRTGASDRVAGRQRSVAKEPFMVPGFVKQLKHLHGVTNCLICCIVIRRRGVLPMKFVLEHLSCVIVHECLYGT